MRSFLPSTKSVLLCLVCVGDSLLASRVSAGLVIIDLQAAPSTMDLSASGTLPASWGAISAAALGPVPEPSTAVLLARRTGGLAASRRRVSR